MVKQLRVACNKCQKMWVDKWGQFKTGNLLCSFFILQRAHKNNCKQGKDEIHLVHSVQQKSSGLIFRTSRTGSDARYRYHHNSSRFTFPIFVHS